MGNLFCRTKTLKIYTEYDGSDEDDTISNDIIRSQGFDKSEYIDDDVIFYDNTHLEHSDSKLVIHSQYKKCH